MSVRASWEERGVGDFSGHSLQDWQPQSQIDSPCFKILRLHKFYFYKKKKNVRKFVKNIKHYWKVSVHILLLPDIEKSEELRFWTYVTLQTPSPPQWVSYVPYRSGLTLPKMWWKGERRVRLGISVSWTIDFLKQSALFGEEARYRPGKW